MDERLLKQTRTFLLACLFGATKQGQHDNDDDHYRVASRRAYRDLCRTLRVNGVTGAADAREACTNTVAVGLKEILSVNPLTKDDYDGWHEELCNKLCETYDNVAPNCGFTLGHAQKWINMATKYLVVLADTGAVASIGVLHVPIDSIVMSEAARPAEKGGLSIKSPFTKWTAISNYGEYLDYQVAIRKALESREPPLIWELETWNRACGWQE